MVRVTMAGMELELTPPERLILRMDIMTALGEHMAHEQTARRVLAAVVLLCWRAENRRGAPVYRGDVLEFGGHALEFLVSQGASITGIIKAGQALIPEVQASMPTIKMLEETEGNSEPKEENRSVGS